MTGALVLVASACSSERAPVTTTYSLRVSAKASRPFDIVVTALPPSDEGGSAELRATATELAAALTELLREEPRAYDHGRTVDATIHVAIGREVVSLRWQEAPATRHGAEAFAAAVTRVLDERTAAAGSDTLAAVSDALAATSGRLVRLLVLAAGNAPPPPEANAVLAKGAPYGFYLLVPTHKGVEGGFVGHDRMEDWAQALLASIWPASLSLADFRGLEWNDHVGWMACADSRSADERGRLLRCDVVIRDVPCDPAARRELASDGTCRVKPLERAEDRARCEDPSASCEGCEPGWCLPHETADCPTPFVRFTGNAIPAGTSAEVTCEVELSARQ